CLPSTDEVETIHPDTELRHYFTVFFCNDTQPLKDAFAQRSHYYLPHGVPPGPDSPNGFDSFGKLGEVKAWVRFSASKVVKPAELRPATDAGRFLSLYKPMIPDLSLRGAAIMGGLAMVLLLIFLPDRRAESGGSVEDRESPTPSEPPASPWWSGRW